MFSQSSGGEATDAAENRIGSLGPYKRLGLLVVKSDELWERLPVRARCSENRVWSTSLHPPMPGIPGGAPRGSSARGNDAATHMWARQLDVPCEAEHS